MPLMSSCGLRSPTTQSSCRPTSQTNRSFLLCLRRRQLDRQRYPDRFEHIWCGDYAKAFDGAYYASVLVDARREGRFCELKADPILPIKCSGTLAVQERSRRLRDLGLSVCWPGDSRC